MSETPAAQQEQPEVGTIPANADAAGESRPAGYPVKDKPRRSPFLVILNLALLAALGALAYLQMQQKETIAALQQRYTELQQQSSGSSGQFSGLQQAQQRLETSVEQAMQARQEELATVNARIASQSAQLDALNRDLAGTRRLLDQSGSRNDQDWLLDEAEALLRLAGERLVLARDVSAAISLFQSADELLRDLDDPAIAGVREILARELAELRALPEVDVPGLYARLGAQRERIGSFAVLSDPSSVSSFAVPAQNRELVASTTEAGWFASVLGSFDKYFVVTKRDSPVTPLLTAGEEYLIRENIQLQIDQARLALLQGEQDIYRQALDAALAAIAQRLAVQANDAGGSRENLLAELTALRDAPILPDIPPLNGTLTALRRMQPASTSGPAGEVR